MKIAIPVDEKRIDSPMCISFGRTPYFMFYNTDTSEASYFDNSAFNTQGGAGIKAAQKIVDEGASVLITLRCGENAAEVLNTSVKIYKSIQGSAKDNIDAFLDGKLDVLTQIHPGFHNHG
ncbi:MAG: dinitrogenase iron-molybdenum cofactor biosynthesis protein [Clostridia bacterium]|nr:dinitrogenase iron-molybdenum cofactor biosynthesis protein [Clostridia bacterium]